VITAVVVPTTIVLTKKINAATATTAMAIKTTKMLITQETSSTSMGK
jgi:hypothetical protein